MLTKYLKLLGFNNWDFRDFTSWLYLLGISIHDRWFILGTRKRGSKVHNSLRNLISSTALTGCMSKQTNSVRALTNSLWRLLVLGRGLVNCKIFFCLGSELLLSPLIRCFSLNAVNNSGWHFSQWYVRFEVFPEYLISLPQSRQKTFFQSFIDPSSFALKPKCVQTVLFPHGWGTRTGTAILRKLTCRRYCGWITCTLSRQRVLTIVLRYKYFISWYVVYRLYRPALLRMLPFCHHFMAAKN